MNSVLNVQDSRICVVGLGYVGLPLAVAFSRAYQGQAEVVGYDISRKRIRELKKLDDVTGEVGPNELQAANNLVLTDSIWDAAGCNVYVVTVPTPVAADKTPDLAPLARASDALGKILKAGDVVIYESTVFPGATEEICVPLLERRSGLRLNGDFFVGYSPERINPGDRTKRLRNIKKVVSGSSPEATAFVNGLYLKVVDETHVAESIRVAEASKIVENIQRDVNIALMNELATIFRGMGIDTEAVLAASGTKWNFVPARPGLVGGHCIGVDPYYMTYRADQAGLESDLIKTARRVNQTMPAHIAMDFMEAAGRRDIQPSKVLVLGFTFKENCPDIRNTLVYDLIAVLSRIVPPIRMDVCDPLADEEEVRRAYPLLGALSCSFIKDPVRDYYDGIILAVAHDEFRNLGIDKIRSYGKTGQHVLYDVKYLFSKEETDARL